MIKILHDCNVCVHKKVCVKSKDYEYLRGTISQIESGEMEEGIEAYYKIFNNKHINDKCYRDCMYYDTLLDLKKQFRISNITIECPDFMSLDNTILREGKNKNG